MRRRRKQAEFEKVMIEMYHYRTIDLIPIIPEEPERPSAPAILGLIGKSQILFNGDIVTLEWALPDTEEVTHEEALRLVTSRSDGWRLPSIDDLSSINVRHLGWRTGPIDSMLSGKFWSATAVGLASMGGYAWTVDFHTVCETTSHLACMNSVVLVRRGADII